MDSFLEFITNSTSELIDNYKQYEKAEPKFIRM